VTKTGATDALLVGAAKLVTSALVLATGFRAVSDDDYARLVIAQRFAEMPSLDPSGTSWLPVPFWTYGSVVALFGTSLGVARATALVLGVFSTLSVLVAARWLGATRTGALAAALVASLLPWSAWLGAATLPEAPTAGLVVLGMASLSSSTLHRRAPGAAALALACFSRYEAWPVAVVFGFLTAVDARRKHSWSLAVPAFVAVLPIAAWLAHGAVRHDDALFFWRRVASYKHALGGETTLAGRVVEPLGALASELPLLAVTAALLFRRVFKGSTLAPYSRGFACCAAVALFLAIGAAGGGAPTHHSARALLPVSYFLACVLGHALGRALDNELEGRRFGVPLGALLVLFASRPWALVSPPGDFAHRDLELHIGERARELGAPALLVDTPDYGYLAVTAAFRRPSAASPVDDHDPRKSRPRDPFASLDALRPRLANLPNAWLVATDAHAPLAAKLGTVRARNAGFTLVEPERADP
jgi:hypothetical protein